MARQAYRGELEHLRSMHVKAVDEVNGLKGQVTALIQCRDYSYKKFDELTAERDELKGRHDRLGSMDKAMASALLLLVADIRIDTMAKRNAKDLLYDMAHGV